MNHRHLTPSMSLLLVFEAAGRHESYTRAAEELSLSQSAISRQIQALETHLAIPLFRREGRSVRLTDVGRRYHAELCSALGRIRGATLQAMAHQAGTGALQLATLPTLGSKWLLPRLQGFYAAHPRVTVHLHSRIGAVDFHAEGIDAAITVGRGDWPGLVAHRLYDEFQVAIVAPQMANRGQALEPAWASTQTLLTVASNPQAWAEWFSHFNLDHRHMRVGPSFELTSHLVQAVQAGMGIGLVPQALVQEELDRGDLRPIGPPMASTRHYYLLYPTGNAGLPALVAFRDWLLGQPA
ncbi:MAG: Glycine cleavage system transcriptional activator [Paracidovorax wautersii]|uniref:Glycine cleavage system transcriptional activator n=1 Tax=Paracidovorax wautersii TaxID=1177982 RepID=A0A7V8FQK2_9BURK|nr:MAG: Glycine cleavage system transcriptional activator [Paracidovorax wautersii]